MKQTLSFAATVSFMSISLVAFAAMPSDPVFNPTFFKKEAEVHENWYDRGPSWTPDDNFTSEFDQSDNFIGGDYFVSAVADDGYSIDVDGTNFINR